MSILKGKTSFLWSLVCLGSPLLFIASPTKNCIKMIFKENRTFPILSEDIERVLSKWWTYWKVPQNSKIIKLLVSKPLRISVPQIRGWTVGCLRRGSRINTLTDFLNGRRRRKLLGGIRGMLPREHLCTRVSISRKLCPREFSSFFFLSFFFKAIPVCFWLQIWLSSAYLHQSYTRSPRTARFWILLP